MTAKLRAELSDAVAGRTLPAHAHERALHFIDFLDKVGMTTPPETMKPNMMTVTDARISPMPRPSLMISPGQRLLPIVTSRK